MNSPRVAVIIVNYRACNDVLELIGQAGDRPDGFEFVVVDNTERRFRSRHFLGRVDGLDRVSVLIAEPENPGYFGAVRYALRARPDLLDCDFVGVANADVRFRVEDVCALSVADSAGVGVIAPRLVRAGRRERRRPRRQRHYTHAPTRKEYARLVRVFGFYPLGVVYRLASDLKQALTSVLRTERQPPMELFAPHGAFMIFTRSYLEQTAGFAHRSFLYGEEVFVGVECDRAGLSCRFDPTIPYSHRGHGSMPRIPSRWLIRQIRQGHADALALLADLERPRA